MSNNGKYVRAPIDFVDSEADVVGDSPVAYYHDHLNSTIVGANEDTETGWESDSDSQVVSEVEEEDVQSTTEPMNDQSGINDRLNSMEQMLIEMKRTMERGPPTAAPVGTQEPVSSSADRTEYGWGFSHDSTTQKSFGSQPSLRWEAPVFPKNVPANKLWEAWHRFLENFEISATLSNAYDPARRAQMLFLSMGEDLQGIVRAAKLRPDLRDPQCYAIMVKNIDGHLKSMTDTSAEHEAFMNMRQRQGESAVAFHTRLQEKARLCGYSPDDQERFVRAQLLKGLANRELAKTARTFGYDTIHIVQSASRDETYIDENKTENATSIGSSALAVSQRSNGSASKFRKRKNSNVRERRAPYMGKSNQGRRSRCVKCDRMKHKDEPCPALTRKCNACGTIGHFAAVCFKKRINQVQEKQEKTEHTGWSDDEPSNGQV